MLRKEKEKKKKGKGREHLHVCVSLIRARFDDSNRKGEKRRTIRAVFFLPAVRKKEERDCPTLDRTYHRGKRDNQCCPSSYVTVQCGLTGSERGREGKGEGGSGREHLIPASRVRSPRYLCRWGRGKKKIFSEIFHNEKVFPSAQRGKRKRQSLSGEVLSQRGGEEKN